MDDGCRYDLEDVKFLLKNKRSPFRIYETLYSLDGPTIEQCIGFGNDVWGHDRNGLNALLLMLGEYDQLLQRHCVPSTDPCKKSIKHILLEAELEELPEYLGADSPPGIDELTAGYCEYRHCNKCMWLAKWRLERGK